MRVNHKVVQLQQYCVSAVGINDTVARLIDVISEMAHMQSIIEMFRGRTDKHTERVYIKTQTHPDRAYSESTN
jgi:hypothetical protein